jgi:hypothetical protein
MTRHGTSGRTRPASHHSSHLPGKRVRGWAGLRGAGLASLGRIRAVRPATATGADATSAESSRAWPWAGGRTLFDLQRAAGTLPADLRHPGRRHNRGCRADSARRGCNIRGIKSCVAAPPRKMGTRAAGVDAGRRAEMVSLLMNSLRRSMGDFVFQGTGAPPAPCLAGRHPCALSVPSPMYLV